MMVDVCALRPERSNVRPLRTLLAAPVRWGGFLISGGRGGQNEFGDFSHRLRCHRSGSTGDLIVRLAWRSRLMRFRRDRLAAGAEGHPNVAEGWQSGTKAETIVKPPSLYNAVALGWALARRRAAPVRRGGFSMTLLASPTIILIQIRFRGILASGVTIPAYRSIVFVGLIQRAHGQLWKTPRHG